MKLFLILKKEWVKTDISQDQSVNNFQALNVI